MVEKQQNASRHERRQVGWVGWGNVWGEARGGVRKSRGWWGMHATG